jgi:hypothetical protein
VRRSATKDSLPFVGTRAAKGIYPIDRGIARAVRLLWEAGIDTYESCEGGEGHPFPEPTIRFYGQRCEGFRALTVAHDNGLRPIALRRFWSIIDGEPTGPHWEMTFVRAAALREDCERKGEPAFKKSWGGWKRHA